jgi:drug/metabolite transporter (DMT)-like permease
VTQGFAYLWVLFTLLGAAGQTARNAMQRELTPRLGALGATLVRFLFGFPFALLFLAATLAFTHAGLPAINASFAFWTLVGALTQIAATALMLKTMEQRSFVVTVAYLKTEPLLVALMGLVFLGDPLTAMMLLAIGVAMAGVALISVKAEVLKGSGGWQPAALGLSSAALFAGSAIGYRGAILSLHLPGALLPATFSLAVGLTLQTLLLMAWLLVVRRDILKAIFGLWRPSLLAGFAGAAGSEMWFLAFALATAASVRTLALVEVLFAQAVSRFVFKQKTTAREAVGIALLLTGAVLIVWANPKG